MRNARLAWLLFAACVVLTVGGLAAVTHAVSGLERAQAESRRREALQEAVSLALYRMDFALVPILATEAARPVEGYPALEDAEPFTRLGGPASGPVLQATPFVRCYFQLDRNGVLTAHPPSDAPALGSEAGYLTLRHEVVAAEAQAKRMLPPPSKGMLAGREQALQVTNMAIADSQNVMQLRSSRPVEQGVTVPVWSGDRLFLARRVTSVGEERIQGCYLDREELERFLLGTVSDLLPNATLAPVNTPASEPRPERSLAALPLRLEPGLLPPVEWPMWSPIRAALAVTWVSALVALTAAGLMMGAALALSERRAAFVSAVTHELRTPLTAFRLYSDMLAEGMVAAEKRQRYYETLRAEATRLCHLVENVLAYSRLERKRSPRNAEPVAVGDMVGEQLEALQQRAALAGRPIVLVSEEGVLQARVKADPGAVERILMNLVDNACKHGSPARNPEIRLRVAREDGEVIVEVADSGPGVPAQEVRRLFRAFGKPARDAAGKAPGVGLGLALSRRLARRMGGDLRLDATPGLGARFVLRLRGE